MGGGYQRTTSLTLLSEYNSLVVVHSCLLRGWRSLLYFFCAAHTLNEKKTVSVQLDLEVRIPILFRWI